MEFVMSILFERRSIRAFTPQPLEPEMIDYVLKAGMNAPSAGNQMPWHFLVVKDRAFLDQIMQAHPYSKMLAQAPVAIVVCGDLQKEHHPGYWVQDCSAASQNILLAATEQGLGSVWLGVYPRQDRVEAIRKIFNIPSHMIPLSIIPLGYPAEKKEANDKFDSGKIHYNHF
jgi:nitroreductase